MALISQKMRSLAPELDPLRLGTGWKKEDLSKPQIIIELRRILSAHIPLPSAPTVP